MTSPDTASAGVRRTPEPADDAARAELARRTRVLAGAPAAAAHGGEGATVAVLVARRGASAFGVRATEVRDVRRAARLSALPGADRHVAGVAAWRGQGIVVHDVLGDGTPIRAAAGDTVAEWLLVVGDRGAELALLADDVEEVTELALSALLPAPDGAPPAHGVTPDGLLLLDLRGWIALHSTS